MTLTESSPLFDTPISSLHEIKEAQRPLEDAIGQLKGDNRLIDGAWYHIAPGQQSRRLIVLDPKIQRRLCGFYHFGSASGHFGMTRTRKRVEKMFYWPNMADTVQEMVEQCIVPLPSTGRGRDIL